MTRDAAQRRNWTFYEAINIGKQYIMGYGMVHGNICGYSDGFPD
jgi:hypothetical protein